MNPNAAQPWPDADRQFVLAWAGAVPLARLARSVDRRPDDVVRLIDAETGGLLSASALARRLGCGPSAVTRVRRELAAAAGLPGPVAPGLQASAAGRRRRRADNAGADQPGRPPAAFDPARATAWRDESLATVRAARARDRGGRPSKAQLRAERIAERAAARRVAAVPEAGLPAAEYPNKRAAAKAVGVPPTTFVMAFAAGRRVGGRLWAHARDLPAAEPPPEVTPDPAAAADAGAVAAVPTSEEAVRVLAARHEAGAVLGRVEVVAPGVVRAEDDDAERAFRRQREREAEQAERDPWRAVLAELRQKR